MGPAALWQRQSERSPVSGRFRAQTNFCRHGARSTHSHEGLRTPPPLLAHMSGLAFSLSSHLRSLAPESFRRASKRRCSATLLFFITRVLVTALVKDIALKRRVCSRSFSPAATMLLNQLPLNNSVHALSGPRFRSGLAKATVQYCQFQVVFGEDWVRYAQQKIPAA